MCICNTTNKRLNSRISFNKSKILEMDMQVCPNCPDHFYKTLTTSEKSSSLTSIPKHTFHCTWVYCLPHKLTECENKHGTCGPPLYVCVCVRAPSWRPPICRQCSAVPRLPLKTSGRADFPAPLTLFAWLLLCLFPGWINISIMSTPPSNPPAILLLLSSSSPVLVLLLLSPHFAPSSIIPCWL